MELMQEMFRFLPSVVVRRGLVTLTGTGVRKVTDHKIKIMEEAGGIDQTLPLDPSMLKRYSFPSDTPVVGLECERSFAELTEREKFYAHYLSLASWVG